MVSLRNVLFVGLATVTCTTAFSPRITTTSTTSTRQGTAVEHLHMSASSLEPKSNDGWTGKPGYVKKSTKSVPSTKQLSKWERLTLPDVMIDPNYYLTYAVALLCPLIIWYHPSNPDGTISLIGLCGGLFHLLFASLLLVQTRRVRLVFHKDGFEFYNIKGPGLDLDNGAWLERKPDNYVVGTHNYWEYDKITNYGFFPSIEYPVIVYFKETQTPEEKWSRWFAAFDSYQRGQPHFFPGIVDVNQFKDEMEKRGAKQKVIPSLKGKN